MNQKNEPLARFFSSMLFLKVFIATFNSIKPELISILLE